MNKKLVLERCPYCHAAYTPDGDSTCPKAPVNVERLEMLTETQRKALEYLRDHSRGVKAADIAAHLWPDSVMHVKTSNQGHGACRGKAAWLCGGAYLSKLQKRGWTYWGTVHISSGAYYLTDEGRRLLSEQG